MSDCVQGGTFDAMLRAVPAIALVVACNGTTSHATAPGRSHLAPWPDRPAGSGCAEPRAVSWTEYKAPGYDLDAIAREGGLACAARGFTIEEHDLQRRAVYAVAAQAFDAAWRGTMARVNAADCVTREQAVAGKHLPPALGVVRLAVGRA